MNIYETFSYANKIALVKANTYVKLSFFIECKRAERLRNHFLVRETVKYFSIFKAFESKENGMMTSNRKRHRNQNVIRGSKVESIKRRRFNIP